MVTAACACERALVAAMLGACFRPLWWLCRSSISSVGSFCWQCIALQAVYNRQIL